MSVSQTLSNLGDAVRHNYLLSNKLKISEMTDLLSKPTALKDQLGKSYLEGMSTTIEGDAVLLSSKVEGGRTVLNFTDGNPVGKTIAIYFQASTEEANGVPVGVGPMGSTIAWFTITGSKMKGYYGTLKYTLNNGLSIILPANSSIKMKDLRVWIIS